MGEQLSKLRDMVEAQTELLQGQREILQRLSPPYRPPPMGGKGWGPTSQAVPVSIEEAIRNPVNLPSITPPTLPRQLASKVQPCST